MRNIRKILLFGKCYVLFSCKSKLKYTLNLLHFVFDTKHFVYSQEPLDCLSELLVCLITLDTLLSGGIIKEHFVMYKNAIRSMYHSPAEYGVTLDRLQCLYKCLLEIEKILLRGNILQVSKRF